MTQPNNPLPFITAAVRQGVSANRILADLKDSGFKLRRQTGLDLIREVRGNVLATTLATEALLDAFPLQQQIATMTTKTATGYLMQVDVFTRDMATGEVGIRPFSVATDTLLTHGDAIQEALDQMTGNSGRYGERILGATYRATYQMTPGELN